MTSLLRALRARVQCQTAWSGLYLFSLRPFSSVLSSGSGLPPKRPSDSWVVERLNIGTDQRLKERYVGVHGHTRTGILMEHLDSVAGAVAYAHATGKPPGDPSSGVYLVTAAVDRIRMIQPCSIDRDVVIQGCVTHTGRSSMEIRLEVAHPPHPGSCGNPAPIMLAYFIFAARDAVTHRSAPVPPVEAQTPLEHKWQEEGLVNAQRRKQEAAESLINAPPNRAEQEWAHALWEPSVPGARRGAHGGGGGGGGHGKEYVYISETMLQNTQLMHPQRRNIHCKVFGGYLMRESAELAWSAALLHSKVEPVFWECDHISFIAPVPLGSVVTFIARVVFSRKNSVSVFVEANVIDPETGAYTTTNTFRYAFGCKNHKGPPIHAYSYGEVMDAVQALRLFERNKHEKQPPSFQVTTEMEHCGAQSSLLYLDHSG